MQETECRMQNAEDRRQKTGGRSDAIFVRTTSNVYLTSFAVN
jgi:hypothetical protein